MDKVNYNSVVSTFCHNVSRNKKNHVFNPHKILNLLYVDDLISIFLRLLNKKINKTKIVRNFKGITKISVKS